MHANLPDWTFWVFLAIFIVMAIVVLWKLTSGELVGSVEGPWLAAWGDKGTGQARVLIRRQGAEKSGIPSVQVQLRVSTMARANSYTPEEARALADLLDEAAHKVDPR